MQQFLENQRRHALLLIDKNRTLLAASPQAADLLGVAGDQLKGKPLAKLANGALTAIALRPNAARATTIFDLPDGRTLLATIQPLDGRSDQLLGWIVTLQDISVPEARAVPYNRAEPVMRTLQDQVQTLQDIVTVLPDISQQQHWQQQLALHIQQLADEVSQQVERWQHHR